MAEHHPLLRAIPKVDELLAVPRLAQLAGTAGRLAVVEAVRAELNALRDGLLGGALDALPSEAALVRAVERRAELLSRPSLRPVINATGVVLHTNFGRAPLARAAVEAVCRVAAGYSNLEYDLETGRRGSRHAHVAELLRRLTGAEDALAVNNNAAAVLLALSALTAGREVVISRGELVEIGGAFRVPEVLAQSGSLLREVGTTNKTRLGDYAAAIGPATGALLKVHTSNFKVVGFTESAGLAELSGLARSHGLPLIHDLGSGCFRAAGRGGLGGEPTVEESVGAGADLVTFSGDKLLGGPQAGLIVGRAELIARIRVHPLARALRIDKLTLAALEATLRLHLDGERTGEIPVVAMLAAGSDALRAKAEALAREIAETGLPAGLSVVEDQGQAGGGSAPGVALEGWAVALEPRGLSLQKLEGRLRAAPVPILARIAQNRLLLAVRTLDTADFPYIAGQLAAALEGEET